MTFDSRCRKPLRLAAAFLAWGSAPIRLPTDPGQQNPAAEKRTSPRRRRRPSAKPRAAEGPTRSATRLRGHSADRPNRWASLDQLGRDHRADAGRAFCRAINKQCKPNWGAQARGPINTAYSDRAQAALNLGGLIADGYVAVEAQDGQQVKNLGRDILALAKNARRQPGNPGPAREASSSSLTTTTGTRSSEELEATQNEVKQDMDALHDEELVTLLSLGGWIRGTQVVSDVVLKNFSQQTSCILRQPALVGYLRAKLDKLSPRAKDSPLVKQVNAGLVDLAQLVSFPLGITPTKEQVQALHDKSSALVATIAKKES